MSVIASLQPSPSAASEAVPAVVPNKPDAKLVEAARQFEAIFVRKMMASMETSSGITGQKQPGSDIYGSMITGALADAATQGDGMGLSALILESLSQKLPAQPVAAAPERPTGPEGIPQ